MADTEIRLEVDGTIALLTVDRPKALNALNTQVLHALEAAVASVAARREIRGLILTGAGEKAFVAGADIAEMVNLPREEAQAFGALGHRALDALEALHCPTVAAVNGFALGGGCELALACDFIYASEKARFGLPEVTLGIIPGFGGTQRLTRLVGRARAKELIYTGDMIDAAKAREIGLVLEVLPPDQLLPHCRRVLERISLRAPLAVSKAKRAIDRGADLELSAGNRIEQDSFAELFRTRDRREGMKAFLEKRPPAFTGE